MYLFDMLHSYWHLNYPARPRVNTQNYNIIIAEKHAIYLYNRIPYVLCLFKLIGVFLIMLTILAYLQIYDQCAIKQ